MTQESSTVNTWWCVNFGGTVRGVLCFSPRCRQPKEQVPLDGVTDCSEGLNVP